MKHRFLLLLPLLILLFLFTEIDAQSRFRKTYQTLELIKTIPAPGPNCQGLTWDGQYLWVSDIVKDSIYRIDTADGRVIHKIPTTPDNHLFEGLAWDGQYLWASHYESFTLINPRISKIDPLNGNVLASIVPYSNNCWPHGVAWDGQYLWVNDFRFNKIRKIDPLTGIGLDSINCPGNGGSIGLAWFDNFLYTGDFYTDSIYQINPVTKQVVNQWACPYTNPRDMEFDGEYIWFVASEVAKIYKMRLTITSVENHNYDFLKDFKLYQNYPNPFNTNTTIQFEIPKTAFVTLKVYNMLGQEVAELVNEEMETGVYSVNWNATGFASGIYFYKLITGDFIDTRKMIVIN